MTRRLRISFERPEDFRGEFDRNIAKGGVFIAGVGDLELREVVEVEIALDFIGEHFAFVTEVTEPLRSGWMSIDMDVFWTIRAPTVMVEAVVLEGNGARAVRVAGQNCIRGHAQTHKVTPQEAAQRIEGLEMAQDPGRFATLVRIGQQHDFGGHGAQVGGLADGERHGRHAQIADPDERRPRCVARRIGP